MNRTAEGVSVSHVSARAKLQADRKSLAMLEQTIPDNELVGLLRVALDVLAEFSPTMAGRPNPREWLAAR
jgi:hypothetical protein